MNEASFQAKVIDAYKKGGWLVFNLSDRFSIGIPDLYMAKNGVGIWRELKYLWPGEAKMGFTKIQKIKAYQLQQAGIDARGLVWVPEVQEAYFVPPKDFEKTIDRRLLPSLYEVFDFNNPG